MATFFRIEHRSGKTGFASLARRCAVCVGLLLLTNSLWGRGQMAATAGTATNETAANGTAAKSQSGAPMTLDEVLRQAERHNASLPVARMGAEAAALAVRQARGRLWPRAGINGVMDAARPGPFGYNRGSAEVAIHQPIYEGGKLRAGVREASANEHAALARFRVQEKNLLLGVRDSYYRVIEANLEIKFRSQAIQRLRRYLQALRERKASGQGVTSAVLKTTVLVDQQQVALADVKTRRDNALLNLNELMGRKPTAPLTLAPLASPVPPPTPLGEPWRKVPDLRQAKANRASAVAHIAAVRAGRRPHLSVTVTAGHISPVFGANNLSTNPNAVVGATGGGVAFSLRWPVWDRGVYRARLGRARILADQTAQQIEVVRQSARLAWEQASRKVTNLFRELGALRRTLPEARDSALNTESLYRGGAATSLAVVDAYRTWISTSQSYVQTVRRYREAQARLARWGTR